MWPGERAEQQEFIALTSCRGAGSGGQHVPAAHTGPRDPRNPRTMFRWAPSPPPIPHSPALPCSSLQDTGLRLLVQPLPLPPASCPRGPRRAAPSGPAFCQPRASQPRAPPMWPLMHAGAPGRLHIPLWVQLPERCKSPSLWNAASPAMEEYAALRASPTVPGSVHAAVVLVTPAWTEELWALERPQV